MLLAWSSTELQLVCKSRDGLTTCIPRRATSAQLMLTAIIHSADLSSLRRLRTLRVEPLERVNPKHAEILISLEEVEMHAVVLSKRGDKVEIGSRDTFWADTAPASRLLVRDILAAGQSLSRAAS